ncbi:hypothetical protein F5B22DRAFT_662354 [Xylaria bambusicola]|uniref:uncharacterized protein n=1 Tax=Xylaria bambusicola TaxID=326684 RepID=UPI002008C12A|nr:uncharacterized protein F5B22DRAFT_662354 [Xylaria bambusicola]KAI0521243.1 hypothetical protein F5B22DRAFT_662354 [Xylaria bambusicola]
MANQQPLDINNVQGDILEGLGKKTELFFFFRIKAGQGLHFREHLRSIIPLITTTTEAKKFHQTIKEGKKEAANEGRHFPLIENSGVNISFSQKGLVALGITDDIGDKVFKDGMLADAANLGDNLTEWDSDFKKDIHGVFDITANSMVVLDRTLDHIKRIFRSGHKDATIEEVTQLRGQVRPGAESGHEHFGFNDGLSQPAVENVDAGVISEPGEAPVRQGVILLGRKGDDGLVFPPGTPPQHVTRPSWALDGSFLAFRYLKQLVPEFDTFLQENALKGIPPAPGNPTGADLLGARLVGRWKSGAPIDLTPLRDNPAFAKRQDFRFDPNNQERCPFAAHIRKTNPRSDLDGRGGTEIRRIIRRGIAFGPEVTEKEKRERRSSPDEKLERGLLFACYQSNLGNGFHFMQQSWANNRTFPPKTTTVPPVPAPGIDPIIGVATDNLPRQMVGASPDISGANTELDFSARWVISRGGEYFFTPSIPALKNTFAAPCHPGQHGRPEL